MAVYELRIMKLLTHIYIKSGNYVILKIAGKAILT